MALSKEQLDAKVQALRNAADNLESLKNKSEAEIEEALKGSVKLGVCCNACQAISPCFLPDQKCSGGCTVTSPLM